MWNPDQCLKFGEERTQPCRDLVSRIQLADVRNFIDLGCGPGNSTSVVAARWPGASRIWIRFAQRRIATGLPPTISRASLAITVRARTGVCCFPSDEFLSWPTFASSSI
jgi:hypothetical protein